MSKIDALFQELDDLNSQRRAIEERERALRTTAIEQCKVLISHFKLTEEELFAPEVTRSQRASRAVPFYFNPKNPQETCGKLGRKPAWYNENLAEGITQEEMTIKH